MKAASQRGHLSVRMRSCSPHADKSHSLAFANRRAAGGTAERLNEALALLDLQLVGAQLLDAPPLGRHALLELLLQPLRRACHTSECDCFSMTQDVGPHISRAASPAPPFAPALVRARGGTLRTSPPARAPPRPPAHTAPRTRTATRRPADGAAGRRLARRAPAPESAGLKWATCRGGAQTESEGAPRACSSPSGFCDSSRQCLQRKRGS